MPLVEAENTGAECFLTTELYAATRQVAPRAISTLDAFRQREPAEFPLEPGPLEVVAFEASLGGELLGEGPLEDAPPSTRTAP
jgi:hypothetical protein